MRLHFLAAMIAATVLVMPAASASTRITSYEPCGDNLGGQYFTIDGPYPYFENIELRHNNVGVGLTSLVAPCADTTQDPEPAAPLGLLNGTQTFNAVIRANVRVDCFSNVPPGGRYQLKLFVDGVEIAGSTKFVEMKPGSSTAPLVPQGDEIAGLALNLAPNVNHMVEVKASMVDGGVGDFGVAYITGQGVPVTANPAAKATSSASLAVGSTWTQITPVATVTTSGTRDFIFQGYAQIEGGTPNDRFEYKFGYKRSTDATFTTFSRTSSVVVPCPIKSGSLCLDFSNTPMMGSNIMDNKFDLASGTWNVALFARNMNSRTTSVSWRQVEVFTAPSTFPKGEFTASTPIVVDTAITTNPQPGFSGSNLGCGYWTNIGELYIPPLSVDSNYIGQGYIEFLGRGTDAIHTGEGSWDASDVEILLEGVGVSAYDFGAFTLSVPREGTGFYFATDAMLWGNPSGMTVRFWARKKFKTTPSTETNTCLVNYCGYQYLPNYPHAKFRIGRRYFSIKTLPAGAQYFSPGP
jgi:hypothetical protein